LETAFDEVVLAFPDFQPFPAILLIEVNIINFAKKNQIKYQILSHH